ncbi:cellulase family glycosylhydrolase [Mycolicibacterium sp. 22603]|uniref:cellulase family glycosylhydrolase n=1 Tax=Mycolicibacterium sp. 22603 TaxID=3453950 RepID=UPI003F85BAD2
MHRRTLLQLSAVAAAGTLIGRAPVATAEGARWSPERAHAWYRQQGWLVGANYIPATATNQIEMWQAGTYDPRRISGELQLARAIGFNTVRVFLHDQLWAQDRAGFLRRVSQFVDIAAGQGLKPLFVLFDSCWDPHPRLGPQPVPRPGVHNSRWVQGPGADLIDNPRYRPVLRDYVTGVIGAFGADNRVLGWDLWNEPDSPANQYKAVERGDKLKVVGELLPQVFDWARTVNPSQPLTSGVWRGSWRKPSGIVATQLDNSDIISFHSYAAPSTFEDKIDELEPLGRPILCTEYLAREDGCTVEGILPVAKRRGVGAYNWGLVAGRTQTYYPWDSWEKPYDKVPEKWMHDLVHPDGRAFRTSEIQTIQQLAAKT